MQHDNTKNNVLYLVTGATGFLHSDSFLVRRLKRFVWPLLLTDCSSPTLFADRKGHTIWAKQVNAIF